MDEKKLSEYRSAIIEHILENKDRFNEMNLMERFECAQEVMTLTKDYCCELFNLDPKKVKTFFIHGSNVGGIAGGRISELGFSAMALTTKKVMEARSIYSLYRTAGHEFKHLDQINNMTAENKETISYYDSRAPFNRFKWASSPSEGSADKFAFAHILGLQRAILKQTDHRFKVGVEYLRWCDSALTSRLEHFGCEVLYGALRPFVKGFQTRHIGEKETRPRDPNDPTKILSFHEIRSMSGMYPEVFRAGPFKPKSKPAIERAKDCIDGFIEIKEWMDGGMVGMPGKKTFAVQGFESTGLSQTEGIVLNATEIELLPTEGEEVLTEGVTEGEGLLTETTFENQTENSSEISTEPTPSAESSSSAKSVKPQPAPATHTENFDMGLNQ